MNATERARRRFGGARVGVVGLGREGLALSRFLLSVGAQVVATDDKPLDALSPAAADLLGSVDLRTGGLDATVFDSEVCFVSPGVPLDRAEIAGAVRSGASLWNETGLLLWLCPAPVIGITGSSGKSTTTALVAAMGEAAGRRVHLGGNIGRPLIGSLGEIESDDLVVMELSSFQLELMQQSPSVAAVTNLTPNHLDRHHTMPAYAAAKSHVYLHQGPADVAVLGADCPATAAMAAEVPGQVRWFGRRANDAPGAYLAGERLVLRSAAGDLATVCAKADVRLVGEHNVDNALAACAVADAARIPVEAMAQAIATFGGLPHRLEVVAEIEGVTFVNDSIATSPERSLAAVRSMTCPVVLLAGGRDKHLPWDAWAAEVARSVRAIVLFGEMGAMLEGVLPPGSLEVLRAADLAGAVRLSRKVARPGDVVLLSPGGTSFDEFRDFEARGERFRRLALAPMEE